MQICIQSLRIEKIDIRISFAVESYATYNCLFFVLGYELPEYMVVVFKWIYQTILISGLYQMLDFFVFQNLLSGCLFVFFGHLHQIQFIAKCTG